LKRAISEAPSVKIKELERIKTFDEFKRTNQLIEVGIHPQPWADSP